MRGSLSSTYAGPLVCAVWALAACVDRSEVLTIEQPTDNASTLSQTSGTQDAVTDRREDSSTAPAGQNTPSGTAPASTESNASASQGLLSNQTNGDSDASEPADAGTTPFDDAGLVGNAGANTDAAPTPGCRLPEGSFHAPGTRFTAGGGLSRCSCSEDQQLSCFPEIPTIRCGGAPGNTCQEGQFCNFPIATNCGADESTGYCMVMYQGCDGNFDPVCGCDGVTQSNLCTARVSGVSVAYLGECQ